ncbi:hypothetical protein PCL_05926 [Purpureocillium lilacinum]|uniref:Uncharacterized protein n=3 Tax=Purpureocillium lilacinum TaxID=33203 RepID=A0A2U3EL82_PURLI|nr:hypothetical protein Purlil1_5867 [Purpureocillium lilacinum]PWI75268.1 hypothetical protein PCL_05926 [Purpureocillium lilacinum]
MTGSQSSTAASHTMLSVHPQDIQEQHRRYSQHYHQRNPHHEPSPNGNIASGAHARPPQTHLVAPMPHREPESPVLSHQPLGTMGGSNASSKTPQDAAVAQALEIARESPDGASDPTVSKILEHALSHIWGKVKAQPDGYIMTRDEFAVFNFFQHRFVGDKDAVAARKRYWDNFRA